MMVVAIQERPDGYVSVECVWFETQKMGDETKRQDWFPPEALDKAAKASSWKISRQRNPAEPNVAPDRAGMAVFRDITLLAAGTASERSRSATGGRFNGEALDLNESQIDVLSELYAKVDCTLDDLPYTDEFERLYSQLVARAGVSLDRHYVSKAPVQCPHGQ